MVKRLFRFWLTQLISHRRAQGVTCFIICFLSVIVYSPTTLFRMLPWRVLLSFLNTRPSSFIVLIEIVWGKLRVLRSQKLLLKFDEEFLDWLYIKSLCYIKNIFVFRVFSESIRSSFLVKSFSHFKIFSKDCQREWCAFFLVIKIVKSSCSFSVQNQWIFIKKLNYSQHELGVTMSDCNMHKCIFEFVLRIISRSSI